MERTMRTTWSASESEMPGTRVSVVGPWVHDEAHDWMEIHPAWWISAGRVQPATAGELRRVQQLLSGVEGVAEEDDG